MSNVYVQTNESELNRVIVFGRAEDGTLTQVGTYETGGAGDGVPHLTSQGSVVVTGDARHLLVTNAGSADVSAFAVTTDGLALVGTAASGGSAPKSVAERNGLVLALNTGSRRSASSGSATAASRRSRSCRWSRQPIRRRSASSPTARRSSSPIAARTRSSSTTSPRMDRSADRGSSRRRARRRMGSRSRAVERSS